MSEMNERRYRIAPHAHARRLDDELVILDLANGEYFGLNDVGADLWAGIESGAAFSEILDTLRSRYDVETEQVAADVGVLVEELLRRGLIVAG